MSLGFWKNHFHLRAGIRVYPMCSRFIVPMCHHDYYFIFFSTSPVPLPQTARFSPPPSKPGSLWDMARQSVTRKGTRPDEDTKPTIAVQDVPEYRGPGWSSDWVSTNEQRQHRGATASRRAASAGRVRPALAYDGYGHSKNSWSPTESNSSTLAETPLDDDPLPRHHQLVPSRPRRAPSADRRNRERRNSDPAPATPFQWTGSSAGGGGGGRPYHGSAAGGYRTRNARDHALFSEKGPLNANNGGFYENKVDRDRRPNFGKKPNRVRTAPNSAGRSRSEGRGGGGGGDGFVPYGNRGAVGGRR